MAFRNGADAAMILNADSTISLDLIPKVRESLSRASVVQCHYETTSIGMPLRARLRALAFRCMNVIRLADENALDSPVASSEMALRFVRRCWGRVPSLPLERRYPNRIHRRSCRFSRSPTNLNRRTDPQCSLGRCRLRMLMSRGPSLFRQLPSGRPSLIEPIIDLWVHLQESGYVSSLFFWYFQMTILRLYVVCGFATVALHILVGVYQGPNPKADLIALVSSPFYVLSKVPMLPAIFRDGGSRANWVRTSRATIPPQERKR